MGVLVQKQNRIMTDIINTFMGWQSYPLLYICDHCEEEMPIEYKDEHICDEQTEEQEEQEL